MMSKAMGVVIILTLLVGLTGAGQASATLQPQSYMVAPEFADYYARHQGPRVLGPPIGPLVGSTQYFEKARLEDHRGEFDGAWAFAYGLLVPELIAARAQVPLATGATMTYADLEPLVSSATLRRSPADHAGPALLADGSMFVPFDPALQSELGHVVPPYFWRYIENPDLFPGGWLHDVGLPLSEAFELDVAKGGEQRRVVFQIFERTILTYDPLNPPEWLVERANTGLAYREAFPERVAGPPGGALAGVPGDYNLTLEHDGRVRSYILHVPDSYQSEVPLPLVVVLHGMVGTAEVMIAATNFNHEADEHGFIVLYPNGVRPPDNNVTSWNAGRCCGYAHEQGVDDVGFIRAAISSVRSSYSIDSSRVYATGFSNGGMMSYRLGCEMSELFAAVAPVAGALTISDCEMAQPVALLAFHGTAEDIVPYEGGANPVDPDPFPAALDTVRSWSEQNGCGPGPERSSGPKFERLVYSGCQGGATVVLNSLLGGGHVWPHGQGGSDPSHATAATPIIWEFFAAHPRQATATSAGN